MLSVRGLTVEVGGTLLVEGVGFTIRAGDRVGLVGRNGAGKTSLLRVLGGMAEPRAGVIQRSAAFGYLPQDPRLDDIPPNTTALNHVLSGRGIDELARRLEELRLKMEAQPGDEDLVARWSRAHDAFEHAGGYAAEAEARRLLSGLGLCSDRVGLPVSVLSGGERRRVELARILFAGSDLLLLDEPTNHLDNDARAWVLDFLRSYKGALLVVSHDLELLDESITRVLHLDRPGESDVGELTEYKGTWSQYKAARERDEARRAKIAARQQAEIARLQALVDRWGAKASKAAFARSLETRIERIRAEAVEAPRARRGMRLRLPPPPPSGRTVLTIEGLAKSYDGPPVFEDLAFDVGRGERVLVLGLNGAGKTSLLRILAGVTEPDRGRVVWGHQVSVGYYAQEHEGIRRGASVLDHMTEASPGLAIPDRRRLLGMFGLSGDKVHQDASTLSGGEKTKLALALLVAGRHNVLLLDEPTNNLDPPSREAVAAALASWGGTMVMVSHDTGFVRDLAPDRAVLMPDGDVDLWSDDLLDLVELA
ncbi:MAG: ABC-F family ATP-binding cassette domain-containing protein [Thermoanaerobacterales bacterium]|jgi:ATPase subunit of ABC transporter with duplicated ATPase domains|nr:ABC-F family ATP-binding cassette domain-containing protein [Thermoanaerobacterales bacterium]